MAHKNSMTIIHYWFALVAGWSSFRDTGAQRTQRHRHRSGTAAKAKFHFGKCGRSPLCAARWHVAVVLWVRCIDPCLSVIQKKPDVYFEHGSCFYNMLIWPHSELRVCLPTEKWGLELCVSDMSPTYHKAHNQLTSRKHICALGKVCIYINSYPLKYESGLHYLTPVPVRPTIRCLFWLRPALLLAKTGCRLISPSLSRKWRVG